MPNSYNAYQFLVETRFFEKISEKQYIKDVKNIIDGISDENFEDDLKKEFKEILLPKRATSQSAGYDFYAPCDIIISPGKAILIPTGIKAKMMPDEILSIYPRSSLGFKYNIRLANSVGIVDAKGKYIYE